MKACSTSAPRAVDAQPSHDEPPIRRVAQHWPSPCKAILQPVRADYARDCGIPGRWIFSYEKLQGDHSAVDLSAEQMACRHCLFGHSAAVHSALHFCRLIGASSVVLVGFDGTGGYTQRLELDVPPGGGQHDRIRRDCAHLLERLDMAYRFYRAAANDSSGVETV